MVLKFRSSSPETFKLIGTDPNGRQRSVVATKHSGVFHWQMKLTHPSGRNWDATFHGENILDAMSELLVSKNSEYVQDGARADRSPARMPDHNRPVVDGFADAPIIPIPPKW